MLFAGGEAERAAFRAFDADGNAAVAVLCGRGGCSAPALTSRRWVARTARCSAQTGTPRLNDTNALATEFRHGQVSLATDALAGARRFANGAGRHGAPAIAG
ncbi:MAG TPA: hypothetical protein VF003_01500 [Pseudonocardiaceae bacterium]